MAFVVVLDACVLYPFSLRDTLLRFAESEAYALRWSDRILGEVTRNLVENGAMGGAKAARLEAMMREAFEDALVPEAAIAKLESSMTNDPGDRHVLAAAVASNAAVIVTANLRHFKDEDLEHHGVEAQHPDEFLTNVYDLDPRHAAAVVREQAEDLLDDGEEFADRYAGLLGRLERAGVPQFARLLRGFSIASPGGLPRVADGSP